MYSLNLMSAYGGLVIACAFLLSAGAGWLVLTSGAKEARWREALLMLAYVLPFVLFVFAVGVFSINVPYWDDYDAILGYLSQSAAARAEHLFAFHNEHRIMFVRLVIEAVYAAFGLFDFRWMIYVGNALFLVYVGLLLRRLARAGVSPRWWCLPAAWSLLSILMYENMFWALTSVQNNAVLLFAWLALLCLERSGRMGWFLASLFFAWLGTYTSGSGLFIWFCLAAMVAKRWLIDGVRLTPVKVSLLVLVALVVIACDLHGFQSQGGHGVLSHVLSHPIRVLAYGALFCGAALHVAPLALPAGVGVFGFVGFLAFRLRRVRDNVTLFFLCFLLCSAASAALFRCGDLLTQALSFRYRVIAVSMLVCCGLLAYEQTGPRLRRYAKQACAAVTFFCVFMNLSAYLLVFPQLVARRARHLEGIRNWPAECSGLVYPDTAKASEILTKSVEMKRYRVDR